MSCNYVHPRNLLVATLQRLYDYGMTTTSGGNISLKDDDGNIWITPGGIDKGSLRPEDIVKARRVVEEVYMDEKIEKYIIDIIFATREPQEYNLQKLQSMIGYGASPRASISLAKAARSYAFIKRRGYVIPEDVRAVCHDVLRHRIGLTYEAEAENVTTEEIVTDILNNVIVP